MEVHLTDEEVRQIILRRRKREKLRRRRRRRIILLLVLVCVLAGGIFSAISGGGIIAAFRNKGPIFIDAGHGGDDPGAEALGRKEKDDTLKLALQVKKCLQRQGYKVVMSRTDDESVGRQERAEMANEAGAKLMVSIHRNQANGDGQGVEAWIHSGGNESAALLAENILRNLEEQGFTYRKVGTGTLADASDNYSENQYSEMPSCIVEVGFLSSAGDNDIFDQKLRKNAKAIASGIDSTYQSLYEAEEK